MHAWGVAHIKHVMCCTDQGEFDCTLLSQCASVLSSFGNQPTTNYCVSCFCSTICLDCKVGFGPIIGSQRALFSSWQTFCNSLLNSKHWHVHENKGDSKLKNKWNNALHSELRHICSVIIALKRLLLVEVSHFGSVFIRHFCYVCPPNVYLTITFWYCHAHSRRRHHLQDLILRGNAFRSYLLKQVSIDVMSSTIWCFGLCNGQHHEIKSDSGLDQLQPCEWFQCEFASLKTHSICYEA